MWEVGLLANEAQGSQLSFESLDRIPRMDGRVAAFVGRVLLQLVGPAAAAGEWQEGAMVKPCEAHLGDGSGSASDHETGVARQGHEEVPGIAHSAGNEHGARPIGEIDIGGGNDADDLSSSSEGMLGSDACRRAAAATDEGDAEAGDEFSGSGGEVVSLRARLGAAEDADLATTG